jgi:hypothetical protein
MSFWNEVGADHPRSEWCNTSGTIGGRSITLGLVRKSFSQMRTM